MCVIVCMCARFVGTHTAQYTFRSDRSCMRTLPPHTAATRAVWLSDLRIQLLVAVCVGMVHMIFSGSSKGMDTAPNELFLPNLCPVNVQSLHPLLRTQVVSYPCNYTPGI